MRLTIKLILGSVLALLLGVAVASPILVQNLELGAKVQIQVDVVYAYFGVQEFNRSITGLWRNFSDPWEWNLHIVSYLIVLNVTNHSDELAMIDVFEVAAAPKIVVEGVSVSVENAIATDARDLRRGYPAFFSQFWSPKESRLIGLTGMKTVPIVAFDALINGSLNLFGRVEGRLYGGGPQSSGFGLKHVQLQMFRKEFLYNIVVSENQILRFDSNGIDVYIEARR